MVFAFLTHVEVHANDAPELCAEGLKRIEVLSDPQPRAGTEECTVAIKVDSATLRLCDLSNSFR